MQIPPQGKNVELGFSQSVKHGAYFWNVFSILFHYCNSFPTLRVFESFGKFHFSWRFFTRYFPCFTEFYRLFYVNGVKVIPAAIFDLLTPVALAHWIRCDGCLHDYGLVLCTHSFYHS
jgi:hypothetical protein